MKHTAVRFLSFASAANILNLCTTHRLPVPSSVNIPAIRVYGSQSTNKKMALDPAPIQGHVTHCSLVDSTLVLVITSSASPEVRGKDFIAVHPMVIPLETTDAVEYQAFNLDGVNDYLARKPMLVELTAEVTINY